MSPLIKIGELTVLYGISSRTLRYYEQVGLLESTRTPSSTYRAYDETAVQRLEQILILRKMQIPIKDIIRIFKNEDIHVAVDAFTKKLRSLDTEISNLHLLREIIDAFLSVLKERGFRKMNSIALLYEETMARLGQFTACMDEKELKPMDIISKIDEKLSYLSDVRIIRIPPMRVVSSTYEGCSPDGDERMLEFVHWAKENGLYCTPGMRQGFMFYSPEKNGYELILALRESFTNTGNYETKTFNGGLFAVTAAYMHEILEKYNQLIQWVEDHEQFELDKYDHEFRQQPMGEILTPEDIGERYHFEQQDIYVPIRVRNH